MKILLIGNYEPDRQQSMQRFVEMLERGLRAEGIDVQLIRPEPILGRFAGDNRRLRKFLGYFDKLLIFRLKLGLLARKYDLVHICDHSNSMYVQQIHSRPHLVTCHDLLAVRSALGDFKENSVGWSGRCLQKIIRNGLSQAKYIACISKNTRADVLRLIGINSENCKVVYMGLMKTSALLPELTSRQRKQQLLHVSGSVWYKNRLAVIKIFCLLAAKWPQLRLQLVGSPLGNEERELLAKHQFESRVEVVRNISDQQLQAYYLQSTALLFPSLIEGFGWPIIEAQSCGCPVITSNREPMMEVSGGAALYIDPLDPNSAAQLIAEALERNQLESLVEAGRINSSKFSEQQMISEYLAFYRQILGEVAPSSAKAG